ncbi:MAG TPA: PBSX family phage terminase large subunit [Sphingomicrobium sp.]|nr:PBSX family phage terminase large subunit [Sphingomicrobium sp.]
MFEPLLSPSRYKAAHGGRGSGKSHFFAELLVELCHNSPVRAVCIREVQNSLKESVRQLIIDKIQAFGLGQFFEVLEAEIRGRNGSLIIFRGMQSYNAESIKSLEGYDIAWVEEAQTLSQTSLDMLRPTIRRESSELWFSWNPRHDTDPVDRFFRVSPPTGAVVVQANWNDNPWLPAVLRQEIEDDRADPEKFEHVWGGGYERVGAGAYFAALIAQAENEGRIGHFPYDPALPVKTAWDIGVDDYTAVWFLQENGKQVRAIDYYEASGEGAETAAQALRDKGYKYGVHFLPHDVMVREWGAGAKTRYQTLLEMGVKPIRVGVAQGPVERINAARRIIPITSFNKLTTALGVSRLRKYRKREIASLGVFTGPLHDENSHGCLVAGSLVTMADRSRRPIEEVSVRDFVWTPSGNCKVLHAGYIKQSESLVDIETWDGRTLTCTPEHKLLTTAGYLEAGRLSPSMTILTGRELRCALIGWLSTATGIGFRAIITGERRMAVQTSTALFGWRSMGRYLTATRSIIATAIRSTTMSPISCASPLGNINESTQLSDRPTARFARRVNWLALRQPSGTAAKLGGNGIRSTPSPVGERESRLRRLVRIAAVSIARRILRVPSFVPGFAKIRRVSERKAGVSVFDLTVESAASYQANGLWVSNSDAFGEFAVNCAIVPPKAAPAATRPPDLWGRGRESADDWRTV